MHCFRRQNTQKGEQPWGTEPDCIKTLKSILVSLCCGTRNMVEKGWEDY